ncbi:MAG: hypothetical protein KAX64_03620, partial [Chromatiaceae bacterium]|nr:hypothetical protein [Chromatiaceae bacterium]
MRFNPIGPQAILPVLVIGYPFVCHIGYIYGRLWPGLGWLGLVFAATAWARHPSCQVYAALAASALGLATFADAGIGSAVLRTPPILIAGGLAVLFGETLRPGRVPLAVALAERTRGTLPPSVAAYGRGLTLFWTLLFLLLAIESLLLALFASDYWWSLITNLVNYLILGAVFVGEYAVRRRVLSNVPHEPFWDYLRELMRSGLR